MASLARGGAGGSRRLSSIEDKHAKPQVPVPWDWLTTPGEHPFSKRPVSGHQAHMRLSAVMVADATDPPARCHVPPCKGFSQLRPTGTPQEVTAILTPVSSWGAGTEAQGG